MIVAEIAKYRAKDRLGRWVYGNLVEHPLGKRFIIAYKHTASLWIEVDPDTVGQFTGLTDVRGTEIYTGDIIDFYDEETDSPASDHICGHRLVVYYDPKQGQFRYRSNQPNFTATLALIGDFGCLVTGNIHDNPDPS